jgi:protein-disulfide isomerase
MAEINLAGELTHVEDVKEIARYGVMGTPALIINGKVVAVGSVPEKKKIQQWLTEAAGIFK